MSSKTREQAAAPSLPPGAAPEGTFRALRNRSYRYLWAGQLGHSASIWMEQVVRPLLILQLTGSPLQVGLVIAARTLPIFAFGLIAGAVADRYDKRKVLLYSQIVTLLTHLALGLLLVSGRVQLWQIFSTAFIAGGATAFNQPARQSLVPQLVPRADLLNALALNSAAVNVMRVLGAGLAGLLLVALGYGEIYLLNALVYGGVIWTTLQISVPSGAASAVDNRGSESLLGGLAAGFRYVNSNRTVLYLVATALLIFILGQPYQQVFVPLLALDVLGVGRSGAGWLLALTGVGALAGSLTVASRGAFQRRGLLMLVLLLAFGLALLALSLSRWLPLSALALVLAGGMTTSYMALNNTLLLERTPPEFHGRVMSLMSLDRGLISVGAILGGGLAELLGPQAGLTVMASACLALTLLISLSASTLRNLR